MLSPSKVYINEPIGSTTRLYQGFTLSGRIALGPHLVLIPAYQTNAASITAADVRLAALNSTTILGAQIPGRPVHRGNLTLDGDLPNAGLELLANLQYVGSNNGQHIDPYALLSLGASHALGPGKLAVLETNVFNTESGALSSLAFAQPVLLSGGGLLYTAANPNPPRQFTLTYSFNTGAQPGAGGARPSRTAARSAAGQVAQNLAEGGAQPQRTRGLGIFTPFPPPPGVDPLSVADKRDACTADDAKVAQPVLEQLRSAVAAYQAGKALPPVDGLALVAHGDPAGTNWYFEVRPNLPPRPADSGSSGQRLLGGSRFAGPPGEGGPGPGGFEGGGPGDGRSAAGRSPAGRSPAGRGSSDPVANSAFTISVSVAGTAARRR